MALLDDRRITVPLLTKLLQGFSIEQAVGLKLFPLVPVKLEAGEFVIFKEEKMISYGDAFHALGIGATPNFIDFETDKDSYKLSEYGVGTKIYKRERAEANPLLKLEKTKTQLIHEVMILMLEMRIATMAQNNANYTNFNTLDNSGGANKWKWSHASADPFLNIDTAKAAMRTSTGMIPDTLLVGLSAAEALSRVVSIQRRSIMGAGAPWKIDADGAVAALASYLRIKNWHIGSNQYTTAIGVPFTDVWSDCCILAHVGQLANPNTQNFGATLRKEKYPIIQKERIPLSDETDAIMERDITQTRFINEKCGYLIEDCV